MRSSHLRPIRVAPCHLARVSWTRLPFFSALEQIPLALRLWSRHIMCCKTHRFVNDSKQSYARRGPFWRRPLDTRSWKSCLIWYVPACQGKGTFFTFLTFPFLLKFCRHMQAAVTKEGLRMFPGAIAHPRVVPHEGAVISGAFIPGGVRFSFSFTPFVCSCRTLLTDAPLRLQTVVGQSFCYVHRSPLMYERPEEFLPDRWLGPNAKACEAALSVFSKGPRSCFGVNLAYAEIHIGLANVFRRFDLQLDKARCVGYCCLQRWNVAKTCRPTPAMVRPASLKITEHFVPLFSGENLHAYCKPARD
jgi:Cytochrome P450